MDRWGVCPECGDMTERLPGQRGYVVDECTALGCNYRQSIPVED